MDLLEDISADFVARLGRAAPCLAHIRPLAEEIKEIPPEQIEALLTHLTDTGQDHALSRLLNACAVCGLTINPQVLSETMKVAGEMTDVAYCCRFQDASAIDPLLAVAKTEELSWQRQAFAVRLAAELAIKHNVDTTPVIHMARILRHEVGESNAGLVLSDTLFMLNEDAPPAEELLFRTLIDGEIDDDFPEAPPPRILGDGGTVRRPVSKTGRNEPCPCGSGKKYKRCCYEADRQELADPSSYAGITQSRLRNNPGIVDDPEVIHQMRAYEVKKLDPASLSNRQLMAASTRAQLFGLHETALHMLEERASRSTTDDDFDRGFFLDLMDSALLAGCADVARRARELAGDTMLEYEAPGIDFKFDVLDHPEKLEGLEDQCRAAILPQDEHTRDITHPLCDLSWELNKRYPALSIVLARAGILERPERMLDSEALVDNVHQARARLGLEPWADPAEEFLEWSFAKADERQGDKARDAEIERLQQEARTARDTAREKQRELSEKQSVIDSLKHKVEQEQARPAAHANVESEEESTRNAEDLERLRRQVKNLKAEIDGQQEERLRLRTQLKKEQRRLARARAAEKPRPSDNNQSSATDSGMLPPEFKHILVPEYGRSFRDHCHSLPAGVVSAALKAIANFVSGDAGIWRHTRPLTGLHDYYRVRIGMRHRLLLRWEPDVCLEVVDLIPRQDLEAWVRRHRK